MANPRLATAGNDSSSSSSSGYVPPPVGYSGVLSILVYFGVDPSNLRQNVLRRLRDIWVRTPLAMRPRYEDEAIMARQLLVAHIDAQTGRYVFPGLPPDRDTIVDSGASPNVAATAARIAALPDAASREFAAGEGLLGELRQRYSDKGKGKRHSKEDSSSKGKGV